MYKLLPFAFEVVNICVLLIWQWKKNVQRYAYAKTIAESNMFKAIVQQLFVNV